MHLLNAELACKIHNWRRVVLLSGITWTRSLFYEGGHIKGGLKCGDTCAKTDIKAAERGLHCLSLRHAHTHTERSSGVAGRWYQQLTSPHQRFLVQVHSTTRVIA